MPQRRNSLLLLSAAVFFLALLLFFLYALGPAQDKSADLQDRLKAQGKINDALSNKLQERTAEQDLRSFDEVQAALPYWDNTEQLLLDLDVAGREAGVTHVSLAFSGDLAESRPIQDESASEPAAEAEVGGDGGTSETGNNADAGSGIDTAVSSESAGSGSSDLSGLETEAAAPGSETGAASGPLRLQVSAVVKGKYDEILNYIERLHKLTRLTTLESLEINRGSGAEQELSVPISFTAYFQPAYINEVKVPLLPYAESSVPAPRPRS
ncbi:hypothetical protein SAMN05444162_2270 [Paenibacillaceae bacterium GAS479]|nr:hypothetical protein SAMN05444162_2270 [Paenibacillaceae bacterium GAS479]